MKKWAWPWAVVAPEYLQFLVIFIQRPRCLLSVSGATCLKGYGSVDAILPLKMLLIILHVMAVLHAAALDISKAFDKMSHYRPFIRLIKVALPKCITDVLVNWYNKLTSAVKWNTCIL